MIKKTLILGIGVLLAFVFLCFAQEEKITITTYYPSPYGVYNTMRLFPSTRQTHAEPCQDGEMYYDSGDTFASPPIAAGAYVCVNGRWQVFGGGGGGPQEPPVAGVGGWIKVEYQTSPHCLAPGCAVLSPSEQCQKQGYAAGTNICHNVNQTTQKEIGIGFYFANYTSLYGHYLYTACNVPGGIGTYTEILCVGSPAP